MLGNTQNSRNKIHPQKFALWAAMASITMMFGAFLSAYIVKQASGNWLEFSLPWTFYISTVLVVSISYVLHKAKQSLGGESLLRYRGLVLSGLFLGIGFVIFQYISWITLFRMGVDLKGNVSGSFLYLITGIHALHVLGGIVALIISSINTFIIPFQGLQKRVSKFDLVVNYWHFVDGLWLVLFLFLLLYK
jgi:cytochrome c oxidase subunit 3